MKRNLHLLIIDPQNDFCDLPPEYLAGRGDAPALPVTGAHQDMLRLAALINRAGNGFAGISVTLDSHHRLHVAHPTFWTGAAGAAPAPFTRITAAEVRAGTYQPRDPGALPRVLSYLDALEAAGRYTLMVWPTHCEIGAWGHNVHADVRAAYNRWEDSNLAIVDKIAKGSNPWTEHYSAIQAEVPDPDDPATLTNHALLRRFAAAEQLYIAGEAGSHCVRATTEHIVDSLDRAARGRVVLLVDCMSAVAGFDTEHSTFLADMKARGVQLATSADVAGELLANAGK